jgi:four helix bundle protein
MLRIYDVSLEIVRDLQPVIRAIRRQDRNLADQLDRASTSVPLHLAEGSYSRGGNRNARYHTGLGEMRESLACLEVAEAKGIVVADLALVDKMRRVIGTLVNIVK